MRITQVTVSLGKTINLGNFNSARVEFSVTADLEPGDDATAIQRELYADVRGKVEAASTHLLEKGGPK